MKEKLSGFVESYVKTEIPILVEKVMEEYDMKEKLSGLIKSYVQLGVYYDYNDILMKNGSDAIDISLLVEKAIEEDVNYIEELFILLDLTADELNTPLISDTLYDSLQASNVSAWETTRNKKVVINATMKHKYKNIKGTLGKVHHVTDVPDSRHQSYETWLRSVENRTGIKGSDINVILSLKVDGTSIVFDVKNNIVMSALKRGNSDIAEPVPLLDGINLSSVLADKPKTCGLQVELYMNQQQFEQYKNYRTQIDGKVCTVPTPLAAVSGIVNSKFYDKKVREFLSVYPIRLASLSSDRGEYAYDEYMSCKANDFVAIENNIKHLRLIATDRGIPADGVVISITDNDVISELGRNNDINRYEVAYKFGVEKYQTELIDIDFSVGLFGSITPVAKVKPVVIDNKTIKSISLGSSGRMKFLKLSKGDVVEVTHQIIPYLVGRVTPVKKEVIDVPDKCPVCNTPIETDVLIQQCKNINCDSRILGTIENYIVSMDIKNIGPARLEKLNKMGYLNDISDLYSLEEKKKEIVRQSENIGDKFSSKDLDKIVGSINDTRKVYDYQFYGSLGIETVGKRVFKKIFGKFSEYKFLEMVKEDRLIELKTIKGIGNAIIDSIRNMKGRILKIIDSVRHFVELVPTKGTDGKTFLFTKFRDKDLEARLIAKGHDVVTTFTKAVEVVVTPNNNTKSTKVSEAIRKGISVMTIKNVEDMYLK